MKKNKTRGGNSYPSKNYKNDNEAKKTRKSEIFELFLTASALLFAFAKVSLSKFISLFFALVEFNLYALRSALLAGNMMSFLILFSVAICTATLCGWMYFSLAVVVSCVAGTFSSFSVGIGAIFTFSIVVTVTHRNLLATTLLVIVAGGFYLFKSSRRVTLALFLFSLICCFVSGGFRQILLCWALACTATNYVKGPKASHARTVPGSHGPKQAEDPQNPPRTPRQRPQGPPPSSKEQRQEPSAGQAKSGDSFWSSFYPENGKKCEATVAEESNTGEAERREGREADGSPDSEVERILSCGNHYSVLGYSKFEAFEVGHLKKEYRKKAVLVHPDKHGNSEKSSEAFKKLQSAYEVLQDDEKRAGYDASLKEQTFLEELNSRVSLARAGEEGLPEGARKVICTICSGSHVWLRVDRAQTQARWCQECAELHEAKEGDGWVEQEIQTVFFGLLPALGPKRSFTLSDRKVFDISAWVGCQGISCEPNTHLPTFVLKTKPTPGGPFDGVRLPEDLDGMTEEEVIEFLARSMASGAFDGEDLERAMREERQRGGAGRKGGSPGPARRSARKKGKTRRTQFT